MTQGNGRNRTWWMFAGFAAIAGFFLFTEHRAHLFGMLPFLLLLACPLLHMFGHGGHGGHSQHGDRGDQRRNDPRSAEQDTPRGAHHHINGSSNEGGRP